MRVWIDMTAPAHVLVFRPLIELLRARGDEVEITTRDYARTSTSCASTGSRPRCSAGTAAGRGSVRP